MTAAPAATPSRRSPRIERPQLALVGLLLAVAALAWGLTEARMRGMATGPTASLGALGFYASVWVVMMAAMMFPSVWPVVGIYERIRGARAETPRSATVLLIGGYLLSWTAWGLVAYAVVRGGHALFGDFLPWEGAGRWVAAGVVLGAALYQVTPIKNACLTRCRGPFMFVMENWRPGRLGALRMGVVHGGWCVGCCWALMAALFALGVMSLGWMVAIAALIAIEKLLPNRVAANYTVAAVLLAVAIGLAAAPDAVPGMPDGQAAPMQMDGMHRMP